jgi:branched-chain amino acid transport system ATP-binding protein
MSALLEVKNLTIKFGGLTAVDRLSFGIPKGGLMGLIGPNGAGKTTVFNMITGVYQPTSGEVFFDGKKMNGLKPFEIGRSGIARTFQNIRLFKELTVLENVLIGANKHYDYNVLDAVIKTPKYLKSEQQNTKKAMELLDIFDLGSKANEESKNLPYGQQRKLEIIRALATTPQLICLDEPAAGMNHTETESLMETISKIRKLFGLTVLLIEHDMKFVMGICENIVVLDHGTKIEEGGPNVIKSSKKVIEAYLGAEDLH